MLDMCIDAFRSLSLCPHCYHCTNHRTIPLCRIGRVECAYVHVNALASTKHSPYRLLPYRTSSTYTTYTLAVV